MTRRLFALLLVVGCSACSDWLAPPVVQSVEFTPPAYYARLWQEIDSCSGMKSRRPMSAVRFAVAITPVADSFYTEAHGWVGGLYERRADRIILAPKYVRDSIRRVMPAGVRHEMLHAHLDATPGDMHPKAFFGSPPTWTDGKCGTLVTH